MGDASDPLRRSKSPTRRTGKRCGHRRTSARRAYDTHERCLDCGLERERYPRHPEWGPWDIPEPHAPDQGTPAQQLATEPLSAAEPMSDDEFMIARAALYESIDRRTVVMRLVATVDRLTHERDDARWKLQVINRILTPRLEPVDVPPIPPTRVGKFGD